MGGSQSKSDGQLEAATMETRVLEVKTKDVGEFEDKKTLEKWQILNDPPKLESLREASYNLRHSSIPVGFPTETVYGLGADATRSSAVRGIYAAKGRPSDNPLIIHVCDLTMLRSLLKPTEDGSDPIPEIYKPLIQRFWPGPLTILLPNPKPSVIAPEVTAGLPTFGARMPNSPLALTLIKLAGVPLAAPSANASTKPSPTTAAHVLHDLNGKIEVILDGGPCTVGVESTVVDGLCSPPVLLRPGGVSIDSIRSCPGWEGVVKGYKDSSEVGSKAPRAPGMKYKHYSPKAKVVLYESVPPNEFQIGWDTRYGIPLESQKILGAKEGGKKHLGYEDLAFPVKIGIVRTKFWEGWARLVLSRNEDARRLHVVQEEVITEDMREGELWVKDSTGKQVDVHLADLTEISLGKSTEDIARGLFAALRELDARGADVIYVEGISDSDTEGKGDEGDIAAAVMNRLRKAASVIQ